MDVIAYGSGSGRASGLVWLSCQPITLYNTCVSTPVCTPIAYLVDALISYNTRVRI